MVQLACKCLNVKVQTQTDLGEPDESIAPPGYAALSCSVALGVAGVRIEHANLAGLETLEDTRKSPATWSVLHCRNCDMPVTAILCANRDAAEAVALETFGSSGRTVLISSVLPAGDELEEARGLPTYSAVFRIVLSDASSGMLATANDNPELDAVLVSLQESLTTYFSAEERRMQERVRKFEEDQRAEFERQQAAGARQREALWGLICALDRADRERAAANQPSPAEPQQQPQSAFASSSSLASPSVHVLASADGESQQDALEAALNDALTHTIAAPAVPAVPLPNAAPPRKASDVQRLETAADVSVTTDADAAQPDADEATALPALFELEGVEPDEEALEKYDLGPEPDYDAEDVSPVSASPAALFAPPPSLAAEHHFSQSAFASARLLATSAPVSIPLNSYRTQGRGLTGGGRQTGTYLNPPDGLEQTLAPAYRDGELDAVEDAMDDDDAPFVAPYVLAKTFREESVFGDLPTRKVNLAAE